MKQAAIVLFLSLLFLVGCTVEEALPTSAPVVQAPTTTSIPQPSTTGTPVATSTPTVTPVPTTTPEPTLRPTSIPATLDRSLPPPTGRIYFLWDPSKAETGLGSNPKYNLYMATYMTTPGTTPIDWNIVPILEGLYMYSLPPIVAISPDRTKLVLRVIDDRNGDGNISSGGAARGSDGHNLYVYTLATDTFSRITDDFPWVVGLNWLPDNQTVTYSVEANVFSFDLADSSNVQLTDTLPDDITKLAWAPDGQLLAIELDSGELYFFDRTTNTITQVGDIPGEFESDILVWSSHSEWLASTTQLTAGLFLINRHTKEIVELVEQDFFSVPVWSPDGQWLAFTQSTRRTHSSLFVWNAKTRMTEFVNEANDISPAVWLPNSSSFAVGLVNDNEGGLYLVDAATGIPQEMLKQDSIAKIQPLSWSPDGEWLLFLAAQSDKTGMHLIHRSGGEAYTVLVMDTTNVPYAVIWLP